MTEMTEHGAPARRELAITACANYVKPRPRWLPEAEKWPEGCKEILRTGEKGPFTVEQLQGLVAASGWQHCLICGAFRCQKCGRKHSHVETRMNQ